MARSRGQMIADRIKANNGQPIIEAEDALTKEMLIKQLSARGVEATKRESLANLKKKLAASEDTGE